MADNPQAPPHTNGRALGKFRPILLALLMAAACVGCAALEKPVTDPARDLQARQWALAAHDTNLGVTSSRGTAQLQVVLEGRLQDYKMAWAAQAPNRLRMTLLALGHPVETVVANGRQATFISHTGRHQPYATLSSDPDLKRVTGFSIRLSEMVAMLLGRLPVAEFDRAWLVPGPVQYPISDHLNLIRTDKAEGFEYQQIAYDTGSDRVTIYQRLDRNELLIFAMKIAAYKTIGPIRVPWSWSVSNGDSKILDVRFIRFDANAPVKESMFMLTPPGS